MREDSDATFPESVFVIQHIYWAQIFDVDLTLPFRLDRIINSGGRALRNNLLRMLKEGTL